MMDQYLYDGHPVYNELIEFLQEKLNIPRNIVSMSIHFRPNALLEIDCKFTPEPKEYKD